MRSDDSEDLGVDRWEGNVKMELKKQWRRVLSGFIWLRIGTCGRLL
jgi:hypothetical protein